MSRARRTLAAGFGVVGAAVWCLASIPAAGLPTDSLYQLRATVITEQGTPAGFNLYEGHPTLVSMFYGSCPAACPMLITAMQTYEANLDESSRARLRALLVSFDAARDTPSQLQTLAREHRADGSRWTFASAPEPTARKIAALLGISYRRLANGDFDHSLVITLLDPQGRVIGSTTRLVGDEEFQAKLRAATAADQP